VRVPLTRELIRRVITTVLPFVSPQINCPCVVLGTSRGRLRRIAGVWSVPYLPYWRVTLWRGPDRELLRARSSRHL